VPKVGKKVSSVPIVIVNWVGYGNECVKFKSHDKIIIYEKLFWMDTSLSANITK